MFLLNSRLGLFTATSSRRHPFSLSYGVILPSSLERVLSLPLVFSTCPPVSVSGTGTLYSTRLSLFLPLSFHTRSKLLPIHSGCTSLSMGPDNRSYKATQEYLPACHRLRFSLRLRSGLTLHGRAFWRNPWAFGVKDSHLNFRYLSRHSHFYTVHICLPLMLHPI